MYRPHKGTRRLLEYLSEHYIVYIHTTREARAVKRWLQAYALETFVKDVIRHKKPAYLYIDDRALCYNGDVDELIEKIENFKVHWER